MEVAPQARSKKCRLVVVIDTLGHAVCDPEVIPLAVALNGLLWFTLENTATDVDILLKPPEDVVKV